MGDVRAGAVPTEGYVIAIEYDANGNPIYIGKALPGTAKTASGWQIMKITYDANGNATDIQWAGGSDAFDKIWNDRATYAYS